MTLVAPIAGSCISRGYPSAAGGTHQAGQSLILYRNSAERFDGTARTIIALPGHGAQASSYAQNHAYIGKLAQLLAGSNGRNRYAVLAIDQSTQWWPPSMTITSIDAALAWASALGLYTSAYGLLGMSMGGGCALQRMKADAAHVAAALLVAPVTDGDWVRSTAGHTPVSGNGTWATEWDAAYGSYAASAGSRIWDEPATWRGIRTKTKIIHATDDTVVPFALSQSFVDAVNDRKMTLVPTTGNHTGLFGNISAQDVVDHFDSVSWAA